MIPSGTYDFGPSDATLHLHTSREGMAKKVGHDLVLEVGKWHAAVTVDGDDITRSTVNGTVDTTTIRVVSGSGGAKPLSDGDRKDIEKNVNDKVLKTSQFPDITFRSTRVEGNESKATVHGDLTIMGKTNPAQMDITVDGGKATARMTVVQTKWGIKPFSALMGALKLSDRVDIVVESKVPQG